jgi:hypothetical protein
MAVRNDFTAGEVLAAADLNDTFASKLDVTAPVGKILQVVQTVKNDIFTTTSTSYVDITGLTVTITPTDTNSRILVVLSVGVFGNTGSGSASSIRLLRDSIFINEPATGSNKGTLQTFASGAIVSAPGTMVLVDSPNTTSATVYKAQMIVNGGTGVLNRLGPDANFTTPSSITVMEVSA